MRPIVQKSSGGFTFIEVLVAMLIFTLAVLAALNVGEGSVRATREAKEISTASWLLQSAITELETKIESEGIDKGCQKKAEGKFDAPYDKFTWVGYCNEIDFKVSEAAAKLAQSSPEDESATQKEDVMLKAVLDVASSYLTKSLCELHVEVNWLNGKTKRQVTATTHVVRFDQQVAIPGLATGAAPQ
jgi:type II secretion system protein I